MSTTKATTSKYIKWSDWDPQSCRFMQPKVNDRGMKTVIVISTQKNKKLSIQTPKTITYGISDYVDQSTGESDGKFTLKMHFSTKDTAKEESKEMLKKLKEFEEHIITCAVENSEAWFGKKLSRELIEDRYFPFLKVGKNSETKQPDETKGYYFRPKVGRYNDKWDIEVFNEDKQMVFPSEDENDSPVNYVLSEIDLTCGIECKSIWFGAKGWGVSWALKQCVVTSVTYVDTAGTLQLDIESPPATNNTNVPPIKDQFLEEIPEKQLEVEQQKQTTSYVEDSEEEGSDEKKTESRDEVKEEILEETDPVPTADTVIEDTEQDPPKEEEISEPQPVVTKPKKVVKKVAPTATTTTTSADETPAPVKKKVVRKTTTK